MSNGPEASLGNTPPTSPTSVTKRLLPFQRLFVDPGFIWAKEIRHESGTSQGHRRAYQSQYGSRSDSRYRAAGSCLQFVNSASGNQGGMDGELCLPPEPWLRESLGGRCSLPAATGTLSEARPGYGCAGPSSSSLGESYDRALYAWGEYFPEDEKFSETELRVWSNQELRQLVVRPSKIRRLYEALKSIVLGELSYRWYQFKTWRRGNSDGAGNYRSLEFAVMFVATAFLFECCVVAFCKGVGR